jgi:rhamnose transport system substrate-binding protein
MEKRIISIFLAAVTAVALLSGCGGTTHVTKTTESGTESGAASSGKYAMILSSNAENGADALAAQGFTEIMKQQGKTYEIVRPGSNAAADQLKAIKRLTDEGAACIAISPVDADSVSDALKAAMKSGIDVCSFDNAADVKSRELQISQTSSDKIAQTFMEAVYDLTGGAGEWAILSESSTSSSQNEWISALKTEMKDDRYSKLTMMEVAYGDGAYQKSYDQTKALLTSYPDLKVLLVPTTSAIEAACQCVEDLGSDVKVTGFGLPSTMQSYVGDDKVCPYFYLWNPVSLGELTAWVSIDLASGSDLTGAEGDMFTAGDLGSFKVQTAADDGTEIVLGDPYRFDASNIGDWVDLF